MRPLLIVPDYRARRGSTKITPPIIPFIKLIIIIKPLVSDICIFPTSQEFEMILRLTIQLAIVLQQSYQDYLAHYQYIQKLLDQFQLNNLNPMQERSKQKQKDSHASKLQRLLCSHSLQGLVYQKRQRKKTQIVNPFSQLQYHTIKSPQLHKNKSSNISNNNQSVQPKQKQKLKYKKIKDKKQIKFEKKMQKLSSPRIGRPKNLKSKSLSKGKNSLSKQSKGRKKQVTKKQRKEQKQRQKKISEQQDQQKNIKKRGRPKKIKTQQQLQKQSDRSSEQQNLNKQNQHNQQNQDFSKQESQEQPDEEWQKQKEGQQLEQMQQNSSLHQQPQRFSQSPHQMQQQSQIQKNNKIDQEQKVVINNKQNKQEEINNFLRLQQQQKIAINKKLVKNKKLKKHELVHSQGQQNEQINQKQREQKLKNNQSGEKIIKNRRTDTFLGMTKKKMNNQAKIINEQANDQQVFEQKQKQVTDLNTYKRDLRRRIRPQPIDVNLQTSKKSQMAQNESVSSNKQKKLMQQSQQPHKKRRLKIRKTKDQALKRFTMISVLSDQEQYNQYYERKRKTGTTPAEKQYQINRIFRKTEKVNLPSVKLDIDIMEFSLINFINKVNQKEKDKYFDLIHCSLPLDMLVRLPSISSLIAKGFLFIWVQKSQIQAGYHWLSRIGFDVIDQIMWIKTNQEISQVVIDKNPNQIFPNCRSTCLVGYKCSSNQKTEYCTKISNNLIFSPYRFGTIEKPDEIYQIGDLMMPGARKLEIGYKELGGWMTLKHHEASLLRCHLCLTRCNRDLYMLVDKSVICNICNQGIKNNILIQQEQRNNQIKAEKRYPMRMNTINYLKFFQLKCYNCKISNKNQYARVVNQDQKKREEKNQSFKNVNNIDIYCKDCLILPEQKCQIEVFNIQQVYFAKKNIKCSKCNKQCMQKYYFECNSCKNDHNLCSKCLFQWPSQALNHEEIQGTGSSTAYHDYKLKILTQSPETRTTCFQCQQECTIPFWGCQVCQNWFWCGRCQLRVGTPQVLKLHQHHCHYNYTAGNQHRLHLII